MFFVGLIIGAMIGGFVGVTVMCIFQISSHDRD